MSRYKDYDHTVYWFSIIRFKPASDVSNYFTLTHDDDPTEDKLQEDGYYIEHIDQIQYDGPKEWAKEVNEYVTKYAKPLEIDYFEYSSPCYYLTDLKRIQKLWTHQLLKVNEAYSSLSVYAA